MSHKRRILIVDDHSVVREGMKRLLERQPDFEVVGECHDGREAVALIPRLAPDVVLMDISMPNVSGLEATREVKRRCPETHILALTVHEDEGYVRELLKAGASGYLLKRASTEDIERAVRAVADGGIYIDPNVETTAVRALTQPQAETGRPAAGEDLSERETEVLRAVALGYSNKEIGARLNLSVKTIETYKARGMQKLGLRTRAEIVRLARIRGWLGS